MFLANAIHLPGGKQVAHEWFSSLDATPTNLGSLLAWSIAAYELGAISRLELFERTEGTLAAIEQLPVSRSRTARSIKATAPQHILIGERGNVAGFLRALTARNIEISAKPLLAERVVDGLIDTLLLIKTEFLNTRATTPRGQTDAILYDLSEEIENCLAFLRGEDGPKTTAEWSRLLNTMKQRAAVIEVTLSSFSAQCPAINVEGLQWWTSDFVRQTQELNRELYLLALWVRIRMAPVKPIMRKYCPSLLDSWKRIIAGLNCLPPVSLAQKHFDGLLMELARLHYTLEQCLSSNIAERETATKRCEELRSAVENALRASVDVTLRHANLSRRCEAIADFRPLFDEEYKVLRSQFQISMLS
jgi:hypothetical protein